MTLRLLIIDDNPADREMTRRLLRSSDLKAEVVERERARDFLDMPLASFDCILLDNRLPDRDGIDVLIEMREPNKPLPRPVIIMSGQGDEQVAARAIKAGASDYLVKDTITPNGLERSIRNAIEKWHLEERVRADWESQKRALLMAERANWAKTQFLSNMSHELRTPLTAILGFSQLIQTSALGETPEAWAKYKDYAGDVNQSAQHLLDMITDILDVARIESGSSRLQVADFDPRQVLADVMSMLEFQIDSSGINLFVDTDAAPESMISDSRAFKTIIINLISNALKYTKPGGHIRLKLRTDGNGRCQFSVADTGIGMDPTELPRLMRPFERYEDTFATQTSGLGIGLSLINSLVRLLRGEIDFDTAPNLGTTVTVTIPIFADGNSVQGLDI